MRASRGVVTPPRSFTATVRSGRELFLSICKSTTALDGYSSVAGRRFWSFSGDECAGKILWVECECECGAGRGDLT